MQQLTRLEKMNDVESGSTIDTSSVGGALLLSPEEEAKDNENDSINGIPQGALLEQKLPERTLQRSKASRALPGIALHIFHIQTDGALQASQDHYVSLADALMADHRSVGSDEKLSQRRENYWIDVDADERDRDELNDWIQSLRLGNFVTDLLTRPAQEWVSHVVITRTKLLIMIRILPLMREEDGTFLSNTVDYLAVVKSKHMVMTYTTTQSGGRRSLNQKAIEYMTQEECLQDGSTSAALIAWLEFHVFRTRNAIDRIRKDSALLVKNMDADPASVPIEEIMQVKSRLLKILAVAEEQSTSLLMLKKLHKKDSSTDTDSDVVDFKGLMGSVFLLISTAEATERMGLRLEKQVSSLRQTFDAHQQDRMNRRLAVLTVVSAVFMPLTFMAGIYGMNFSNMPELEYVNGYYILLTSMLVIATSMIFFFYYHGWFE